MLGKRIKELREKIGWSRNTLSKESYLSYNALAKIERDIVKDLNSLTLIKIADALHLNQDEFIYLIKLNHQKRRFQAYNVGIVKTGTFSIAGIFSNYRSLCEFKFKETTEMILKFKKGKIAREEFRRCVRKRDNEGILEMDSASFNYFYLDILVEEFPSAKFIFTIRDCYSWVDSLINMFLGNAVTTDKSNQWIFDYSEFAYGLGRSIYNNKKRLMRNFNNLIDKLLAYWDLTNREIIKRLPLERSLIVRTTDISNSVERMADFVGVPRETLIKERSHLFKARHKFNVLHEIEYKFLNKKFKHYCSPLMERFFPGYTLRNFLKNRKIKRRLV